MQHGNVKRRPVQPERRSVCGVRVSRPEQRAVATEASAAKTLRTGRFYMGRTLPASASWEALHENLCH
jgi:hypothetical protein